MASTAVAERKANPVAQFRQGLDQMADQIRMALPAHVDVDKFQRVAVTAIQNNQDLLNANRRSLFGAIVRAAQDGLLPDGREGAIVRFKNDAAWMPMVAGILKLVRNSGELSGISAHVVYENDEFDYDLGDNEFIRHKPTLGERGEPIAAYAVATLKDGFKLREIMSVEQIEQVRAVSRAKNNGPWVQWWSEMARKTVIRRLAKRLPMSTDLEGVIMRDETMQADFGRGAAAALSAVSDDPAPSRLDALEQRIADDEGDAEIGEAEYEETEEHPSAAADPQAAGADEAGAHSPADPSRDDPSAETEAGREDDDDENGRAVAETDPELLKAHGALASAIGKATSAGALATVWNDAKDTRRQLKADAPQLLRGLIAARDKKDAEFRDADEGEAQDGLGLD